MNTYSRKKQHHKCIDILELIEYAERKVNILNESVELANKLLFTPKQKFIKEINDTKAAIKRLESYYLTNLKKIENKY